MARMPKSFDRGKFVLKSVVSPFIYYKVSAWRSDERCRSAHERSQTSLTWDPLSIGMDDCQLCRPPGRRRSPVLARDIFMFLSRFYRFYRLSFYAVMTLIISDILCRSFNRIYSRFMCIFHLEA